jgi:hypothetical protein
LLASLIRHRMSASRQPVRDLKWLLLATAAGCPTQAARLWSRSANWTRHEFVRNPLAHGLEPLALKAALGKHLVVVTMREWEIARGHHFG